MDARPAARAVRFLHPLLAAFLYTGGRRSEVLGLEFCDVDFDYGVVHFCPNTWRRLKRRHHKRTVPLWPDLRQILAQHIERSGREEGLLFPAQGGGAITDPSGSLATALERAAVEKNVTLHTLRHTYTATRMQTLDHGAPVSPYTVMRELGHRDLKLIEDTYGHLQARRDRVPVVQYRETKVVDLHARRGAR